MSKLSATTIFGRLKATGKTILNGDLQVNDTIKAENGIAATGGTIEAPVYATEADLPQSAPEGSMAYVQESGTLYVEDGS